MASRKPPQPKVPTHEPNSYELHDHYDEQRQLQQRRQHQNTASPQSSNHRRNKSRSPPALAQPQEPYNGQAFTNQHDYNEQSYYPSAPQLAENQNYSQYQPKSDMRSEPYLQNSATNQNYTQDYSQERPYGANNNNFYSEDPSRVMSEQDFYAQQMYTETPLQSGYNRTLPMPNAPYANNSASATPSIKEIDLHEPQSIEYESNISNRTPIDPRLMPQVDPQLSMLYDVSNAPPADSRLYQAYQQQRLRHLKQVELTSGNLIVDCPVPDKIIKAGKYQTGHEFTHMRYTACTCDPNEYMNEKYTLRPAIFGRETEIFVVLTMYNEEVELFSRTFKSMVKNITHLCSRTKSRTWGADAWKKVVICVVSDGRNKINKRTLNALGCMGVYQEGVMQNSVSGRDVEAHIFEYTTQVYVDTNNRIVGSERGSVPVQVVFCLKEKNAKKINSHRWFFNAFSPILNPNICVLIDVGTKPSATSIYYLWKAFDKDPSVAGACGEICVDTGEGCCDVLNPLVAAQNFEYKMSNILDKPLESVFGYISVLPGAFSAYRYLALQNTTPEEGPLSAYFKGELMHSSEGTGGIFEANMYLAEDRILCFELVAKRNKNYILKYVKSAKAVTDVPDTLSELISQRRRWLNGSFFAMFYAIAHWYRMFSTDHNIFRKFLLFFEFIYQCISMFFTWFSLANFYLAFYFLSQGVQISAKTNSANDPFFGEGVLFTEVIRVLYVLALIMVFILALGNRPQGSKFIYGFCVFVFALIMIAITYIAIFGIVKKINSTNLNDGIKLLNDTYFRDIIISTLATYGMYLIASIMYFEPWHMVTCLLQYVLWVPSSINILMVYAFCNVHDVSWGTKGDTTMKNDLGHAKIEKKEDGVQVAHVNMATDIKDVNMAYENFLQELTTPIVKKKEKRDASTKREDSNKMFRTTLVLSWTFSNVLLVMLLSSNWFSNFLARMYPDRQVNPYLSFIFWSVAVLSAIRFLGSVVYIITFYTIG
ncbi:hypothetical protein BB561_005142 [Smittium simulii]|uniref:Chitin synthase n=1 Tax=Smittium simulii TaxID=133385 RepID=A0A2T9YBZ6_9FUNG|nr:hypothetical protein BB561_005142 [Smittium simulii]